MPTVDVLTLSIKPINNDWLWGTFKFLNQPIFNISAASRTFPLKDKETIQYTTRIEFVGHRRDWVGFKDQDVIYMYIPKSFAAEVGSIIQVSNE